MKRRRNQMIPSRRTRKTRNRRIERDSGEMRRVGERQSAKLKKNEKNAAKASSLKRGRTRRGVPFGGEESNGSESTETPSKKAKPGPQVIFIRRLIC